ncbi:glycosyltransferase [Mangrovimonas yunxiaonensis]|uniref:Glycosyltransferase n=1 Tax=Mangrovimonas yunxiaonensis TaxID=1197477 RepID=A0A084TKJ5_9FLAO|nr:glycosyltransferase family 4 protein [Mangrovimonas yunxiaonensis]KFB01231.1 glycosyltransferase [Mangrovimonas yunxiaonensis]GGH37920.1 glycosyltransferase WbuB [Mangrovimonas yunxiaonensis]
MAEDLCIITNYFPPETGAASNRIFQLAKGLQRHNFKVTVVTPLPNYPKGSVFENYKGTFKHTSEESNMTIHRLWIYASNSKNKLRRLLAMLSYSFSLVWFFMWHDIPKKVIVQSPPLLVAFTCMLFLNRKNRTLILNVSDLWPIAGLELGAFKKNFSYRLLERIERFNYSRANLILGQSHEILAHVGTIVPQKQTFLYRNYPDFKPPAIDTFVPDGKIKLVYAGLLGVAQGIYKLCEALDYTAIEFHIYGAGAEQKKIETFISENPKLPITYHGEVTRKQLHQALIGYDVTLVPLLKHIYGSVPSKLFEYAYLGLPTLYFGGGEGEKLVLDHQLGWVAEAGNYSHLNQVLSRIDPSSLHLENRLKLQQLALNCFDFNKQLTAFAKLI